MDNLKTQKLKIKAPLRRVEIPSKHDLQKKHLHIHSSPDEILLNFEEKKIRYAMGFDLYMISLPAIYV